MGQRPLVMPSRLDDPPEKLMWGDEHWAHVEGGRASVELVDGNVYLAMSLRNVGNGTAVLQGWRARPRPPELTTEASDPETFRRQLRDLYVPAANVGFWQAAIRDAADPDHGWLQEHIEGRTLFMVEPRRAKGTTGSAPSSGTGTLDRPNPR